MTPSESTPSLAQTPVKSADQKHCYSCGTVIHGSAQSCPDCGAMQPLIPAIQPFVPPGESSPTTLPLNHVFCRGCGKPIHSQAPTCPKCGAPQYASSGISAGGRKERVVAALMAFFLGGIGGHKFYLGQIGMGILYLLFCWTFIPAIIALIEGIIYLTMSDADFAHKYG
jgi:TM2 domain-containing membrane protein YozV/RNA polymerase subunit RPABC4/transcription elongation factor Spt4